MLVHSILRRRPRRATRHRQGNGYGRMVASRTAYYSRWRRKRVRITLTLLRIVMDEIETKRAIKNLMVLTEHIEDVNISNAFKMVAAMFQGLQVQISEMQMEEDDE